MTQREDFSSKDMKSRVAEGRNIWEPFVIDALALHGIVITPSNENDDIYKKIDGWYNKETVQIKIRNTSSKGRNDLSFELAQNYNPLIPLSKIIRDKSTMGRDWKGDAKHYFILNRESNLIYHVDGKKLKKQVLEAVEELEYSDIDLRKSKFTAENLIEINATIDRDEKSHTLSKVMAFIPIKLVLIKEIKISE